MEQRECSPNPKSSIKEKLDRLSKDIQSLPEKRKAALEELLKKKLLDLAESCAILGISLPTLRRAIADKRIKTVKIGRCLRIPIEEIQNRMESSQQTVSVLEAAEIFNVTPTLLRNLITSGKIKAFRFAKAGRFRIPIEEIERIYNEGVK